ncbi:flagellar hook assembly protein FlgD [Phenylobacterium sp.]|jgi:flagellar basal-body rod modification protein FlgD|uniref:flagellar hook assembly protein FlgD n=1 Tax=Phenylobacterium sp. TaxID=1871053 RepID=UPI002E378575|nr:flagellar hook capping FlgD N-terminal domain-containing protein [Phenylobacterium sp.]HEX3365721.1 flagellar hook capping FlgD N-terminal domain-containing protein [Phenylobacterium sp.]
MTVTAPTATSPTPPPSSTVSDATAQGLDSLTSNFNTFLTLLTTQLKNQDPTSPLDSNQFTQQLVQMTGVEQQLNTNSLLKQVVSNTSGGISTAVSLIGKQVKAASDTANLTNGQAQWTYNLPSAATDLKVQVLDAGGNIVAAVAPTDLTAGDHAFSWNGKDLTGAQLPNGGTYTLQVTATDANGAAIASTNYVQGIVTGVTQNNGTASITINGGAVDWTKVVSVNQAATTS